MTDSTIVHVAVGLIVNAEGEVLISYRHPDSHQGSLWEFPGGKVEAEETVFDSLKREFMEELGVSIRTAFPVRKISHAYSDKNVLLDIWRIDEFDGTPSGLEGQEIQWRTISQLRESEFPKANGPIIELLKLPDRLAITPAFDGTSELLEFIEHCVNQNITMIQLRQKHLESEQYIEWFEITTAKCKEYGVTLIANVGTGDFSYFTGQAIHLSSANLKIFPEQLRSKYPMISASCHDLAELHLAEELDLDFVLLSPVQATAKYSDGRALGWEKFRELASQVSLPVYALGGLSLEDSEIASKSGASGIAGISLFVAD